MEKFRFKPSVAYRIWAVLALLAGILVLQGFYSVRQLSVVGEFSNEVYEKPLQSINFVAQSYTVFLTVKSELDLVATNSMPEAHKTTVLGTL
ncbi:MAG: hypothetical protein JKY60_07325, partial [Kordiimonadaceae bacterium]|nr:hypothetical protein [Kordiimonadaceae bacterium]